MLLCFNAFDNDLFNSCVHNEHSDLHHYCNEITQFLDIKSISSYIIKNWKNVFIGHGNNPYISASFENNLLLP